MFHTHKIAFIRVWVNGINLSSLTIWIVILSIVSYILLSGLLLTISEQVINYICNKFQLEVWQLPEAVMRNYNSIIRHRNLILDNTNEFSKCTFDWKLRCSVSEFAACDGLSSLARYPIRKKMLNIINVSCVINSSVAVNCLKIISSV